MTLLKKSVAKISSQVMFYVYVFHLSVTSEVISDASRCRPSGAWAHHETPKPRTLENFFRLLVQLMTNKILAKIKSHATDVMFSHTWYYKQVSNVFKLALIFTKLLMNQLET